MFWAEFPLCDLRRIRATPWTSRSRNWLVADQGETGLEDTGVFESLDLAAQGEGEAGPGGRRHLADSAASRLQALAQEEEHVPGDDGPQREKARPSRCARELQPGLDYHRLDDAADERSRAPSKRLRRMRCFSRYRLSFADRRDVRESPSLSALRLARRHS